MKDLVFIYLFISIFTFDIYHMSPTDHIVRYVWVDQQMWKTATDWSGGCGTAAFIEAKEEI